MEEDFLENKEKIMRHDISIIDIEIMSVFGKRWGNSPEDVEMMLRIIYKGKKRLITTAKGHKWLDKLTKLIHETRTYYRTHKLERILDGVL